MKVAWISDFPVEWLEDAPAEVRSLPRQHPRTWQRVLLAGLRGTPDLDLHVFSLRKEFSRSFSFTAHGATFHLIKTPPWLRGPSCYWIDTMLLRRALRRLEPDLVHAWGTEKGAGLTAARLGRPHLVTIQGLLMMLKGALDLNAYTRFNAFLEPLSLRRARHITSESRASVDLLSTRFPSARVHQIEHAPDRRFHEVVRAPACPPGPARLVFVGNFTRNKGCDLLVHALDELQGRHAFELVCIGPPDAAFVNDLRTRTSASIWQRIRFAGTLDSSQIAAEYRTATLLVFPSRGENSPNVVKEAVVGGLPVVCSATGATPEYVVPDRNGFLVPPGDQQALTLAINAALSHPLFSRGTVDPATRDHSRDQLSPARMTAAFLDVYRQILGGR